MSQMIRAGVIGASGKMGGLIIQNITRSEGIELSSAFDLNKLGEDAGDVAGAGNLGVSITSVEDLGEILKESKTDVLIDFTIAAATASNAPIVAASGVNLIIGTTGFSEEQKETIEESILKNGVSAVIAPNYAVGVNVFFKIIEEAAKYLPDYDIEVIEAHHNRKKDAPSGTAMRAAEVIGKAVGREEYIFGRQGNAPRKNEIGIHAIRGGDIAGDHTILFAGEGERIEIKHQAHSRDAFAAGAVKAAIWLKDKKSGIYSMEDILGL